MFFFYFIGYYRALFNSTILLVNSIGFKFEIKIVCLLSGHFKIVLIINIFNYTL